MGIKVIGKVMNNGFAGYYARHPESVIVTRPNEDDVSIPFGTPLAATATGGVVIFDSSEHEAEDFVGVAGQEIRSNLSYLEQDGPGEYPVGAPVSVFQRGSINVLCAEDTVVGTPATISDNAFDVRGAIELPFAQYGGEKDGNDVVELVLLSRNHA